MAGPDISVGPEQCSGYRPESGSPIDWPEWFGTRFTLFVDTEEEFDWRAPLDRGARSTASIAALADGHKRLRDRGAAPVYLIDHPVATAPSAVEVLREVIALGGGIGTQLHPWVNPPFDEPVTPFNSFAGNLPCALEAAKIDMLTAAIENGLGVRPRLYRAGRYGIGRNTSRLLAERGYRIDSSMRSRYDYSGAGGPDFGNIGNHAFWLNREAGLAELPLTTVFTGLGRKGGERLYRLLDRVPRGRGVFARAALLSRVALTPEDMPISDAIEAVRIALGEGVRLLNFSFHSPSLMPGFTPYVRDAADLKRFYHWWDRMLDLLASRDVLSASEEEVVAAIDTMVE